MTIRDATDGLPRSVRNWIALFVIATMFGVFVALAYADGIATMHKNSEDIVDVQADITQLETTLKDMSREIAEMKTSQAVLIEQLENLNRQLTLLMGRDR